MNKISQVLSQKLTQKLELRPKMLESLQMLAMPLMQLEVHLKNELVTNPMLELQDDYLDPEENQENNVENKKEKNEEVVEPEQTENNTEVSETIEEAKELSEILDHWNEFHSNERSSGAGSSATSEENNRPETYAKAPDNPRDKFIEQLYTHLESDEEMDYASEIIESVDSHGFLAQEYDIYELGSVYQFTKEKCDHIHEIIKKLTPKGITAKSIEECLLAQVEESMPHSRLISDIISNDFQNLIHRRYQLLAGKYAVSQEMIIICKNEIGRLDPKPGLRILANDVSYIVPDVVIKKVDNEYIIIVNDFNVPNIVLSKRYSKIVKDLKSDKDALGYVRGKISSAKFLIKSMYMRNRTLERVTKAIIEHQRPFFYQNTGVLEPLTYAVIAAELQVNESTISRVVRKKYADSPFGIMCLKDFFTSTAGKDKNYDAVSRQQVQVIIQKLIDGEDKQKPLSDQELMKILKERGISVSRRVIAKYREGLGILNSRLRRKS